MHMKRENSRYRVYYEQYHGEIVVFRSVSQRQDLLLVRRHSQEHAVKNVVVSLLWGLHQK